MTAPQSRLLVCNLIGLALERARAQLGQKRQSACGQQLAALLADLKPAAASQAARRERTTVTERFVLKAGGRIFFVKAEEIERRSQPGSITASCAFIAPLS